jgi:hypothetical protein
MTHTHGEALKRDRSADECRYRVSELLSESLGLISERGPVSHDAGYHSNAAFDGGRTRSAPCNSAGGLGLRNRWEVSQRPHSPGGLPTTPTASETVTPTAQNGAERVQPMAQRSHAPRSRPVCAANDSMSAR